ncbi:MAG TPA: type I methionyl aminopeptidase [Candidatus Sulfomarinibacteraceae bacterium]|nr:type I methionyl aminopeptidase [Candidatus Sulfomarinibacteraceae bacterium]
MGIKLKRPQHIEALREANRLVAETFREIEQEIKPGARLSALDRLATAYIESRGAKPLYKGYRGTPPTHPPFPGTICASVNQEICHGLPNERTLQDGDIIGIDIGLRLDGWCGDACVTFAVGQVAPQVQRLLDATRECLDLGIAAAQPGQRLTEIGAAIQARAEDAGYSVVREWGGHGVGRSLHEEPSVPHVGPGGRGPRLRPGMVFTIEPMINVGGPEWRLLEDGWTVVTRDSSLSAQFEHTIAITDDGPLILSQL